MVWKRFQKKVYFLIKRFRMKTILRSINPSNKNVLDIGCQDLYLYNNLKNKFDVVLADYNPLNPIIKKQDVQKMSFKDKSFDCVICLQVLEHVPNPVEAIKELRRVAKKQLIISVPYEPFFSLYRFLLFFGPEKEHLFNITPEGLSFYLGKPKISKKLFFNRYYLGVWEFK